MQTLTFGPEHGDLLLHTGVEGKAARLGHRLTLIVAAWECRTELDGDTPVSVVLDAQLPSLEVLSGEGGAKPLSDKDKRTIKKNALESLKADSHPTVRFVSTSIVGSWEITGEVSLHGTSAPLRVSVTVSEDATNISATGSLTQTTFGIKPYSQMLGALAVADEVGFSLEATIPAR